MFDKDKFIQYLDSHAYAHSGRECAKHVREALEAAGLDTWRHPGDAKTTAPFWRAWDFARSAHRRRRRWAISRLSNPPLPGKRPALQRRHIAAYDGHHWVSDFIQHHDANDYYGGTYRKDRPPVTFYRYEGPVATGHAGHSVGGIKPICPHCTSQLEIGFRFSLDRLGDCGRYRGAAAAGAIAAVSAGGIITPLEIGAARANGMGYQLAKWAWHCVAKFGRSS